jgi:NADPH:quinone reductase-like Zn-dependent oxidoreductase/acyl carrier protein
MALSGAREIFGESACLLERVSFTQMLIVPQEGGVTLQLAITIEKPGAASFTISSRHASWVRHASGNIRHTRTDEETAAPDSPDTVQARCVTMMPATELWRLMAEHGVEYGPSFQKLEQVWSRDGEAIGRLQPCEARTITPAFLDACLQVVPAAFGAKGGTWLPAGIDSMRWLYPDRPVVWSHARIDGSRADLSLLDSAGQLVGSIDGLRLQQLDAPARTDTRGWLHELRWVAQPLVAPEPRTARSWLIVGNGDVDTAIAERLRDAGDGVTQISREALSDIQPPLQEIVCLLEDEPSCDRILHLLQILGRASWRRAPRLWLITRGAQPVNGRIVERGIWQATFWGLGRTVHYEHPELNCTLVDLDPESDENDLILELLANNGENQIAFRDGSRYVARVALHEPDSRPATFVAGSRPFRLEIESPGILDGLCLHAASRRTPRFGEVEIEVSAAGLNFLDVLLALGILPDDAPGAMARSPRLGGECSGRIVAVGDGVTDFQIGDDVIALAPWSFGRFVTTPAARAVLKPANIPAEQAAALPIAFLTADYALNRAARLAPGERVLIHAATGGVGLAAIQIARRAGAEVFATAGSPEKREYLRALGVSRVSDSRSAAFVDDVRSWTNDEGVDVVLNSLSGELIEAGFNLLRDHGRFIEIGKRDYYAGGRLGLRPFLRNLSFTLVDLLGMSLKRPLLVRDLLRDIVARFESGELQPMETRVTPVAKSAEAFRTMAQARHIGKIVISMQDSARAPIAPMRSAFDPDGTYLITGGIGGLGLTVARWMVGRGAQRVVLMSRRAPSSEVQEAIAAMGGDVRAVQADVSDRDELAGVLSSIKELRGVVHAAGILDDALLLHQTPESFRSVMASKVDGAWNLHLLTRECSLDHFVLFSSAAGVMGAPAQGNYAAANAFLDALAHYRRAQGLPALSIGWGAWSEVGLAAAQSNRGDRLGLRGMQNITPEHGLVILEQLLNSSACHVAAMPINVRQWRQFYPKAAQSALFELLRDETANDGDASNALRVRLECADAPTRRSLVEEHLQQQLARVLRIESQAIDPVRPLKELGFDSLMALEFRNRLELSLGLTLPATLIWGHPTLADLAPHLASQMGLPLAEVQAVAASEADDGALSAALTGLDEMSEDAALSELRARA